MKPLKSIVLLFVLGAVLTASLAFAATTAAPPAIVSALLVKVLPMEKKTVESDVTVYVLGASDVAAELQKVVGTALGSSKLAKVESGDAMPSAKPSVLFVGSGADVAAAIAYAKSNAILSVTNNPDYVTQGVALGFGVGDDGKPKILLNLSSSVDAGLNWNPALLKIAQTVQ